MSCCTSKESTYCLSDDGTVHSFGSNSNGQLGLSSNEKDFNIPSPIFGLPKIQVIACGGEFAACIDNTESLWTFGCNLYNQLGHCHRVNYNFPKKVENIPPVSSVSCGLSHILVITIDSDLWGFGNNEYGQLFLEENQEKRHLPKQTSFSGILKISCGGIHSFFQDYSGKIYGCGSNAAGQLGSGLDLKFQIKACLIQNQPNIVQFCCGFYHSLFLDVEGNVYSVGQNHYGQLGLGNNLKKNKLQKIDNIPCVDSISCVGNSSYLVDCTGQLWSFGDNFSSKLGHGHSNNVMEPTKVPNLTDNSQISCGPFGGHFLAKDSQNAIHVMGRNFRKQLGPSTTTIILGEKMDQQYFNIWGDVKIPNKPKPKSARK